MDINRRNKKAKVKRKYYGQHLKYSFSSSGYFYSWLCSVIISFILLIPVVRHNLSMWGKYEEQRSYHSYWHEKISTRFTVLNKVQEHPSNDRSGHYWVLMKNNEGRKITLDVTPGTFMDTKPGDIKWFKVSRSQFDAKMPGPSSPNDSWKIVYIALLPGIIAILLSIIIHGKGSNESIHTIDSEYYYGGGARRRDQLMAQHRTKTALISETAEEECRVDKIILISTESIIYRLCAGSLISGIIFLILTT